MSTQKLNYLAFIICLLAASFYMYEFALQVSLGAMTEELMRDLHLNAITIGALSAVFFYAYMPMQIPAGMLHDFFGPRLMLTLAILVCATGALCFGLSHSLWMACLGRVMMGAGGAFSFSGALLLISRWFAPGYFAVAAGFVQLMSSVGAITGELALAVAIQRWDWRPTILFLFFVGLVLAVLVLMIVRNHSTATQPLHKDAGLKPSLKTVFAKSQPWWIALYSFLIWAPIAAFAGLWGIPFLVTHYQQSVAEASFACAFIWIGIGLGCPAAGWLSEYLGRRLTVLNLCSAIGLISSLVVIYCSLSFTALYIVLFLLGCAGSGQALAFSVVRDISHPRTIGAAIGLNNTATVAGGAILQPIIGYALHYFWSGKMQANVPVYQSHEYQLAFVIVPLCYLFAFIIGLFFIKETHCVQTYSFESQSSE